MGSAIGYGSADISRRAFLGGAALLASFTLGAVTPATALGTPETPRPYGPADGDLARYRPVKVSSTAWAPTPKEFAVDGLAQTGVRGSGWRAEDGDRQWIAVDLQARCQVEAVTLVFEATVDDPEFRPPGGPDNPRAGTDGTEILSSCATAFSLETSLDGTSWTQVYTTDSGTGGVTDITLESAVGARWVRMSVTKRSNGNPLGLNSLQVFGTAPDGRPAAEGWTSWTDDTHHGHPDRQLAPAEDGTVPLESGWYVTIDDWAGSDDGAVLSDSSTDTSDWLPATVPGTIHASLVDQGRLPDPAYGFGNLRAPEALSRHSWWYHRSFDLPTSLASAADRRIWLEFDGINHHAEIWLNGTKVGELTHPFARARLDVTDALRRRRSGHALAVRIDPMPFPGSPGDKSADGRSYNDAGSDIMNRNTPTYLSISGWDWMPAVRDRAAGIWNHVRLRSTGDLVIGDLLVHTALPELPDTGRADLTVTVPVRNTSRVSRTVRVAVSLLGIDAATRVTVDAGSTTDVTFSPSRFTQLQITDPQLWWPNGYGEPTLHDLTARVSTAGRDSDARTARFGIRQLDFHSEPPDLPFPPGADHRPQTIEVGTQSARYLRILAHTRATPWGASLWTLSVFDSGSPATDLARGRPVTASSSDNATNTADNAVDGNDETRWSSAYQDEQWIQLDFGAGTTFDQVELIWESAFAKTFSIQASDDGSSWRNVKDVDNSAWLSAGTPLQISVNGVRVFCRGGNWGLDELLRRMLPDRMDAAVAMHRDMNFTMIRNWIGQTNREEFFAKCDEYGLLVWNDFWSAWYMDPPDHDGYLSTARDTIRRFRIHPCLAVWCSKNEGDPSAAIDDGLRAAVAEEHPGSFYQGNSAGGIVSGGGPYWLLDPEQYFSSTTYSGAFGFHTEIGMPTVPVAESMHSLAGDQPVWPIGDVWYLHDWCTKGAQGVDGYRAAVETRLGSSSDLDDFCRKAQFVNYESMRAMFEAWNAHLWDDASGLLLWMSNPAHHSTVWQTYDYDLDVNGSYHGAKKGCEALHVQADPTDWTLRAVNHTPTARPAAVVHARLVDLKGRSLGAARQQQVDLRPSATASAFAVPFDDQLPALHLLVLELRDRDDALLSENSYLRYRKPADVTALNDLGTATVRTRIVTADSKSDPRRLTVELENAGAVVAAMVRLDVVDRLSGERVLPALVSENYQWLLPGQKRRVDVSWPPYAEPTDRSRPEVRIEAYNLPERPIR